MVEIAAGPGLFPTLDRRWTGPALTQLAATMLRLR
ncbi:hypothetical protein E9232_003542 [Inquilinus ginsengisoli]|uniref:Uncharacterized protein n=1 Tax=Inquilinus ginsengisoli TaxID=363840 RepID=A0ABU1JQW9_9PROT|nr:hypothetical protein [Inquilinus ginsengisoli]